MINDFEYNFFMDTTRKRILSTKQESIRYKVNKKVPFPFVNQKIRYPNLKLFTLSP